jgi:hypothetical protein
VRRDVSPDVMDILGDMPIPALCFWCSDDGGKETTTHPLLVRDALAYSVKQAKAKAKGKGKGQGKGKQGQGQGQGKGKQGQGQGQGQDSATAIRHFMHKLIVSIPIIGTPPLHLG